MVLTQCKRCKVKECAQMLESLADTNKEKHAVTILRAGFN